MSQPTRTGPPGPALRVVVPPAAPPYGLSDLPLRLDMEVTPMTDQDATLRLREICLSLPEATEKPFGGHTAPSYRVRDKLFVMSVEDGRSITFKAGPGVQEALVGSSPERFFVPAYVGPKGWVGARLDADHDWDELAELIEDSYRLIAPKRLTRLLDDPPAGPAAPHP